MQTVSFLNKTVLENLSPIEIDELIESNSIMPIPHYAKSHLKQPVFVTREVWDLIIDNDTCLKDSELESSIYWKAFDILMSHFDKWYIFLRSCGRNRPTCIRLLSLERNTVQLSANPKKAAFRADYRS